MFFIVFLLIAAFGIITIIFFLKVVEVSYPYFFWGAIYVPSLDEKVNRMIKFLEIKPGQKIADLGAGDGKLVIAAAKAGAEAYGYEINPFLVSLAKKNIKKAGLENKAFVYCKNLWSLDLRDFDAVVVYGMTHMMKKLEKKLEKELKPGARVVSNYFTLPAWKPDKIEDKVYLYIKK